MNLINYALNVPALNPVIPSKLTDLFFIDVNKDREKKNVTGEYKIISDCLQNTNKNDQGILWNHLLTEENAPQLQWKVFMSMRATRKSMEWVLKTANRNQSSLLFYSLF